jgi:TetR/AcrR family transcriptional regulator, transcriptional repressor for nem operon
MAVTASDTKQRILDAARLAVQARGYGGLSFRDLAAEVGIKSASIHYHFPTKGDLGAALTRRYTSDFAEYLDGLLTNSPDRDACIRKYTDVFRCTLLNGNRMCLGGFMAAEHDELPEEVRAEVVKFSEMNARWLAQVLSLRKRPTTDAKAVHRHALAIFAAIMGAQLVARSHGDVNVYDEIVDAYRKAGLLP